MTEITSALRQFREGDPIALHLVFEALYPELRRIAQSRVAAGARTLTPTALVSEAFVRLVGNEALDLNDRRHFLACAARAMRAIVVDSIRRKTAQKRGGSDSDFSIDAYPFELVDNRGDIEMLALDQALDRLNRVNPRQREVVELRYFAGLEFPEICSLLGCSERTAKREWERARAFLYVDLAG